ncbi:MAG: transporter substrate-binding domain-containing protein [Rhizobiales bacterium]|nr:transporter substrate-binding domain-containing protein [Hyphomicrobiales bacterium]OJY06575.1 MAG: amino acid ABC transporter [Rhizobiales bacterium 63-22]
MKRRLSSLILMTCWLWAGTGLASQTAPGGQPAAPGYLNLPDFLNPKERLPLPSLQGLNRLRFITTVDFPPFNMLDDRGQLSGYNIDLARALCRQLGIADICQIEAAPWSELESRLGAGEADAIIGGLRPTSQNRQSLIFTRSYMRLPARFVTLKAAAFTQPAAAATRGKTVGVVAGTAHEQMLKAYFPQADAKPYPDRAAMLAALKDGKIAAAFDDGMTLSFWLNSGASGNCCTFTDGPYLAPQYLGDGLAIAVTQQNAAIAAALDNAFQALQQQGVLTELYLRYFPTGFY